MAVQLRRGPDTNRTTIRMKTFTHAKHSYLVAATDAHKIFQDMSADDFAANTVICFTSDINPTRLHQVASIAAFVV